MNGLVFVWKKREGDLILLIEVLHISRGIANTNADHLYLVFKVLLLDITIEFVHPERFFPAGGSVPAENLDDNNPSPYLGNGELAAAGKS